jgi:hypothetical protein
MAAKDFGHGLDAAKDGNYRFDWRLVHTAIVRHDAKTQRDGIVHYCT